MRKNAQITMESLLLYGAAILVVLLAIAALTYFGVLDLGRLLPEKCNFKGSGIFNCEEYAATLHPGGDLDISLVLSNRGTKTVTIKGTEFNPVDTNIMTSDCKDTLATADEVSIAPGGTGRIDIHCTGYQGVANSRLSGTVKLTHSLGVLDQTTSGDITITMSEAST